MAALYLMQNYPFCVFVLSLVWLLVPLLFYWVARIWLLAQHGQVNEYPIVFAIKDRVSYVIGALGPVILFVAL